MASLHFTQTVLLGLVLCGVLRTGSAFTLDPSQVSVLADFSAAWNVNYTAWNAGGECTKAYGLTCDGDGMITSIDFSSSQFVGSLPTSVYQLSNLTSINLSGNALSGSIPATLGQLTKLRNLIMNGNLLDGTIPSTLGNLYRMTTLDLSYNHLGGTIPATLGSLAALQYLQLNNNQLWGSFPSELTDLKRLRWLQLNNNTMASQLPVELINLPLLNGLGVDSTLFCPANNTGCGTSQPQKANAFCTSVCVSFCDSCILGQKAAPTLPTPPPAPMVLVPVPSSAQRASLRSVWGSSVVCVVVATLLLAAMPGVWLW